MTFVLPVILFLVPYKRGVFDPDKTEIVTVLLGTTAELRLITTVVVRFIATFILQQNRSASCLSIRKRTCTMQTAER